jgi:hypothetical protein
MTGSSVRTATTTSTVAPAKTPARRSRSPRTAAPSASPPVPMRRRPPGFRAISPERSPVSTRPSYVFLITKLEPTTPDLGSTPVVPIPFPLPFWQPLQRATSSPSWVPMRVPASTPSTPSSVVRFDADRFGQRAPPQRSRTRRLGPNSRRSLGPLAQHGASREQDRSSRQVPAGQRRCHPWLDPAG